MLDIMIFFNTAMETLSHIHRSLGRLLVQPILTAVLLTGLYAGYHCVHEWSIVEGLWIAFFETNAGRAVRLREREDAILQAELRHLAEANRVIDQLLEQVLDRAPNSARARLDVIHNGVTGLTGVGLLRYDIANSVAGPGHAAGPLVQNRPLAEWGEFLPALLEGACQVADPGRLRAAGIRSRMESLNVGTVLVCPVADLQGRLLGAVFLLWDAGIRVPEGADMEFLSDFVRRIGSQIATVLNLRLVGIAPKS